MGASEADISLFKLVPNCSLLKLRHRSSSQISQLAQNPTAAYLFMKSYLSLTKLFSLDNLLISTAFSMSSHNVQISALNFLISTERWSLDACSSKFSILTYNLLASWWSLNLTACLMDVLPSSPLPTSFVSRPCPLISLWIVRGVHPPRGMNQNFPLFCHPPPSPTGLSSPHFLKN